MTLDKRYALLNPFATRHSLTPLVTQPVTHSKHPLIRHSLSPFSLIPSFSLSIFHSLNTSTGLYSLSSPFSWSILSHVIQHSTNQSITQSVRCSLNPLMINPSIIQSFLHSIRHPFNLLTTQTINYYHSVRHSINLPLLHSVIQPICLFIHSVIQSICLFTHSVIQSICVKKSANLSTCLSNDPPLN